MSKDNQDIRWLQRFANYQKAFLRLQELVEMATQKELSDIEKEALIQRFEYTHELSWKVIMDFYKSIGEIDIQGSRDAFKLAFNRGLISKGREFLESVQSRNEASHAYNQKIADKVYGDIINKYYDAFAELETNLKKQKQQRGL